VSEPSDNDRLSDVAAAAAESRRRSAVSGLLVLVGRGLQVGLRLVAIAILARLLTPDDFGVRALVLPVIVLTNAVINLRLNVGALQQELDSERMGELFHLSMRFNLLIVLIVAAVGPLLSELYGDPRVIGVTAAWAVAIFALNFGAFHESLLKRQLRIGTTTAIELVAMLLGLAGAIVAGSLGAGYWALVIEIGLIGVVRSAGAWLACPWRPPLRPAATHDPQVTEMLRFGRNLAGVRIAAWLGNQVDRVLVGMLGGAPILGLYDGARRWSWVPATEMDATFAEVAISSMGRVQERPEALHHAVRGAITATLFFALPATAFVFIEAEGTVRLLFGRHWLGAVPFMELMAVAAFFAAIMRPTAWIFQAHGRTRRQFRWGLVHTGVILGALLIGSSRGALGIATAFAVAYAALALPSIWFCVRGTTIGLGDYAGAALRPATAAAAGSLAAVGVIRALGDIGVPARMTVEFVVLFSIYLFVWLALPGGRSLAADGLATARELASGAGIRARAAVAEEASVTGD